LQSGDFIRAYAALLEDCGVESIWGVEHVVIAEDHEPRYPYSESGDMGPRSANSRFPTRWSSCRSSRVHPPG